MKTALIVGILVLVAIIAVMLFAIMDSAISLDQCRQQNLTHVERCELLVKLANSSIRGGTVEAVVAAAGPNAIVKLEGNDLWIDDVALRVENGIILEINLDSTCHH